MQLREGVEDVQDGVSDNDTSPIPIRTLMKTYSAMLPIATYGTLALVDTGFMALVLLFYATPIEIGGLGLPPSVIGTCMAIWGLFSGLSQILFVPKLIDRFGEKKTFRIAVLGFFPLVALFPAMSLVVRSQHKVGPSVWPLMILQLFFVLIGDMSFCMSVSFRSRRTDELTEDCP